MTNNVSYKNAVQRSSRIIGKIEGVNIFNVSSIIAIQFQKSKEEVIDDLLKSRASDLGITNTKKLKKVM